MDKTVSRFREHLGSRYNRPTKRLGVGLVISQKRPIKIGSVEERKGVVQRLSCVPTRMMTTPYYITDRVAEQNFQYQHDGSDQAESSKARGEDWRNGSILISANGPQNELIFFGEYSLQLIWDTALVYVGTDGESRDHM